MAKTTKISVPISNDFCPQSLYLYGTYDENAAPHFGLFCWFGWCWLGGGEGKLGVMACIGEEKLTKDLIRRNGVFSANLVSEPLLPLADYYGNTSGRDVPGKMERLPTVERGQALDVPNIAESPVSVELKVVKEEGLASGSTLFLCEVVNVSVDQRLADKDIPVIQRMKLARPVSTVAEETYVNFFGDELGRWGEPMRSL